MYYYSTNKMVKLGDHVLIDGKTPGVVVCDFDAFRCLRGHAYWLAQADVAKEPGILDRGVMIKRKGATEHFPSLDDNVRLIRRG